MKLFERRGNSIALTEAGQILFQHTRLISEQYKRLDFDLNALNKITKGELLLAASTTIAQYVLPDVLAGFHQKFPDLAVSLTNGNTERVERLVLERKVSLGLIEGVSKRKDLKYTPFLRDEIVLVVRKGHPLLPATEIELQELANQKMLLREYGSGTLEVLESSLNAAGFPAENLNVEMRLGSSESIKRYLKKSDCCAFLSVQSVHDELKSGALDIVGVKNLKLKRSFFLVQSQGDHHPLADLFIRFLTLHYNFK